ncbi:5221_t:CDS:2 [Paraglomus brasilianum]|uniref:5221_t:CDS:1 n=1 Tax=Paraglomus brasilianum TaxID=144538 RepID=A0A9N9F730_9GLOM|nr:5221_t:CDS:2 [Paraglomus brasilianum]
MSAGWLESFFTAVGLPKLAYHWQALLFATLACNFTVGFSRIISPILFPKTYKQLSDLKRLSWDIHVVSLVHSVAITALSAPLLFDETLLKDKVFGYDEYAGNVYAIACGYFLWDSLVSLYYVKAFGVGFVVHGASCFGVYLFAYRPFLNYYGAAFLMFELSTPFLNLHWFMDKVGATGSLLQFFRNTSYWLCPNNVHLLLILTCTVVLSVTVLPVIDRVPIFLQVIYGGANVILNTLNVFWFFKMLNSASRRFPKSGQPIPPKADIKDTISSGESWEDFKTNGKKND